MNKNGLDMIKLYYDITTYIYKVNIVCKWDRIGIIRVRKPAMGDVNKDPAKYNIHCCYFYSKNLLGDFISKNIPYNIVMSKVM